MRVSHYIDILRNGEAAKLAIVNVGDMSANPVEAPTADQVANQLKFVSYINAANLALHKRFNLRRLYYELDNPIDGEEYTLPDNFLAPIEAYYSDDYAPVRLDDQYRRINEDRIDTAVSILFTEPFKIRVKGTDELERSQIILEYSAAPTIATKASSTLQISQVFTEALVNYAAYKAHAAINGDTQSENNAYYLRYEASCRQLISSGLSGNNGMELNTKLDDRGFV